MAPPKLCRLTVPLLIIVATSAFRLGPQSQSISRLPSYSRPRTRLQVVDTDELEEIRSMRVKEIKAELSSMQVSSADAFEKEELVQRLFKARREEPKAASPPPKSTTSNGVKAPRSPLWSPTSSYRDVPSNAIRGPLFFTSMDAGRMIAALNDAGLTINPSEQPFATIQLAVENSSGPDFTLSLLLDTACSGLVLRPSVVKQYDLRSYNNPVTMTGAGGTTTGATGLTQLDRVEFGGETFGPMPAAVQDIGALPSSLDGIIGLSFLSQFACVEMDFRTGTLTLYKIERKPPVPENLEVIAEAEMSKTSLGIWICDVLLDGRGPIKMLVDSGASNTLLHWKGASDLGLSRDSPLMKPITVPTGAMGSDNIAMKLTHRLTVEETVNLGRRPSHTGLSVSDRGAAIDIGEIAVLAQMWRDNVAGILGIDIMMRCAVVRMSFKGPVPRITLMN